MKQLIEIMMVVLSVCLLTACSSDDGTIGYETYDAEYQIKYYSRPPVLP
jgi:major membrane immunogen (membrane-anchored lipoprotein)